MSRKFIVLIITVVVLAIVTGYLVQSQNPFFNNQKNLPPKEAENKNHADITLVPIYEDSYASEIIKNLNCINDSKQSFIIRNNRQYQKLLKYDFCKKSSDPKKRNYQLPSIDFSKYSLLGRYAERTGCEIEFDRKVYKNDVQKKFTYIIDVIGKNSPTFTCFKMGYSMNWILISAIPEEYSAEIQVNN